VLDETGTERVVDSDNESPTRGDDARY